MAIDITDIGACERKDLGDALPLAALTRAIGERWSVVPQGGRPANIADIYPLDLDRYPTSYDRLAAIRDNVLALAPFFLNLDASENDYFGWSMQPWYFDRDYIARTNPGILNLPRKGSCWGRDEPDVYRAFLSSAAYWLSRFRFRPATAFVHGWWRKSVDHTETRTSTETSGGSTHERRSTTSEGGWTWVNGSATSGAGSTTQDDARAIAAIFHGLNADEHTEYAAAAVLPIEIAGSSYVRRVRTEISKWDDMTGVKISDVTEVYTSLYLEISECPQKVEVCNPTGYVATALLCSGSGRMEVRRYGNPPPYTPGRPFYYGATARRRVETYRSSGTNGTSSYIEKEEHDNAFLETAHWTYPDEVEDIDGLPGVRKTLKDYTFDGLASRTTKEVVGFDPTPDETANTIRIQRHNFNESFGIVQRDDGVPAHIASLGTILQRESVIIPFVTEENGARTLSISLDADPVQLLAEVDSIMPTVPDHPAAVTRVDASGNPIRYAVQTSARAESEISMPGFGTRLLPVLDFGPAYKAAEDEVLENWAGLSNDEWRSLHPDESEEGE